MLFKRFRKREEARAEEAPAPKPKDKPIDTPSNKNRGSEGWSQDFEYREQKNIGGNQFAAVFTFNKEQFEGEEFQAAARGLFWDEAWISYYENTWPEFRERMKDKLNVQFPRGINIFFDTISEPFNKSNKGYFKIIGDDKPLPGQPHIFFQRLGNRTIVFTNQHLLDNMKDYEYVQAMLSFFKQVFRRLEPLFGYLDRYNYIYSFKLQKDPREYAFGLTFYGKKMVEQIGRDKLLRAPDHTPAYAVEEFDHGGIMLQIHENPFSYINWPHRKKIMSYLGLKPKKLAPPQVPEWLKQTKPPSRVHVPAKRKASVVIGLNARELEVAEGFSLYSYFYEQIFPKVRSEVDAAFALAKWFNALNTGLTAYVSGTDMAGEYEVFVGQEAGKLAGFKTWQRKLDPAQVAAARQEVAVTLKRLGLATQPELNCLLYHVEGL